MKEKEIQAFIESLEVKALNGKQQSFSEQFALLGI